MELGKLKKETLLIGQRGWLLLQIERKTEREGSRRKKREMEGGGGRGKEGEGRGKEERWMQAYCRNAPSGR